MEMGNCSSSKNKITPIDKILDLKPLPQLDSSKGARKPFIEERMIRPQRVNEMKYYAPYPLPKIGEPEE